MGRYTHIVCQMCCVASENVPKKTPGNARRNAFLSTLSNTNIKYLSTFNPFALSSVRTMTFLQYTLQFRPGADVGILSNLLTPMLLIMRSASCHTNFEVDRPVKQIDTFCGAVAPHIPYIMDILGLRDRIYLRPPDGRTWRSS